MSANLEYQKLACHTLRLVHPSDETDCSEILLDLGVFRIIESDVALDQVIERYLSKLKNKATEIQVSYHRKSKELLGDEQGHERRHKLEMRMGEYNQQLRKKVVLTCRDFLKFNGHGDAELKRDSYYSHGAEMVRDFARKEHAQAQRTRGFDSSRAGYRKYLKHAVPELHRRLSVDIKALVKEQPRIEHTYLIATTNTGKSELIKALCLQYVEKPEYAGLVVLDPAGDLTPEIARWPELIPSGRLVYIDPTLDAENMPVINPFDAEHLNDNDRGLLTEQIVSAIGTMIEGKAGGTLTVNMEAVLYPSVRFLVDLPNATLRDLQRLMKGDERLFELACQSPRPEVSEFFSTEFNKMATLTTTKQSVAVKIGNILSKGTLEKVLCGRTSIDLERLMSERKIILVNLAKGRLGASESSALGTLLVSLIQSICMKRERIPKSKRPVTHLIIDECQNFLTTHIQTIIRETRKFGLSVTLVQQEVGGGMSPDLEKTVTRTTSVKIAGRSAIEETRRTGALVNVAPEDITALDAGQFFYKNGTAPSFLLRVRADRLGNKGGVSRDTWSKILEQQKRHFYRSIHDKAHHENGQNRAKKQTAKEKDGDKPKRETGYDFE
jgi:hypothetical protein